MNVGAERHDEYVGVERAGVVTVALRAEGRSSTAVC
jgi:hypothetical protein